MPGVSSQSTAPKLSAPHKQFTAAKPELGDSFILPGLGSAYESFVVSASKQFLMKGNAIALFTSSKWLAPNFPHPDLIPSMDP